MANNLNYLHSRTGKPLFGATFAYLSQLFSPVLLFVLVLSLFAPFIPTEVSANHTSTTNSVTFDADATWSVPTGATQFTVKVWGAGGNGGVGGNTFGGAGTPGPGGAGGGGAGGYVQKTFTVDPAISSYAISVGTPTNTGTTLFSTASTVLLGATKGQNGGNGGNAGVFGLGGVGGGSIVNTATTYTSAGTYTYTVPAGVTSIQVETWGGGGGGGTASPSDGTNTGSLVGGGGAGSGAYSRSNLAVIPGQTFTVIVGTGGVASTDRFVPPGSGTASSFVGNTYSVVANGGDRGFSFWNGNAVPNTIGGVNVVLPTLDGQISFGNTEYVLGGLGGTAGTGDVAVAGNRGGTVTYTSGPTIGGPAIATPTGAYGKGGDGNDQNIAIPASEGQAGAVVISSIGGPVLATNPDVIAVGATGANGDPGYYRFGCPNGYSEAGFGGMGGTASSTVAGIGGAGATHAGCGNGYGTNGATGGIGSGGGGGGGYNGGTGVGGIGGHGRVIIEYSTPIPDPVVPPTISCSATPGVLDLTPSGVNSILSWATTTPTTTVLEVSNNLVTWSVYPTAPTIVGGCYTVTASTTNVLAQINNFRLTATSTPVVPPVTPKLPTCSAVVGVLSTTASSTDSILTWATTTPLTFVAQRSTDLVNWSTITTAHPVINNCFSVTASTTDLTTGLPNNFRLFDTTPTPVIPPASTITCPITLGVLALTASSTNSILTWASTTPVALVAQSSTDLTNWTTLTTTPPIVNNCFTVVASTTAPGGLTNFFRLFDTTPTGGGGGGGGTPAPTVTATIAISGATTTAPMNNLPFAVTVGGTAVGPVFHQIDCTSDGTYDYASTTPLASFITPGICTYTNPGTYTALAQVGRGGATTTTTTIVTILAGTTIGGLSLNLNFTVSPSTGVAPLNNVGFTGTVAGTAIIGTATTTFSFDCLNDGSFEFSSSTLSTTMTQANLCSYTNPGTYVARLLAVRDTFMVSATTSVNVLPIPVAPPSTSGGGGGAGSVTVSTGGGGGGPIGLFGTITPQPNGGGGGGGYVSPQPVTPATGGSCTYLTEYMRADFENSASEVAKLQVFLKDTEKMDVSLTNVFDKQTEDAVKAFQVKYSVDVLEPWGTTTPTGYVFITTQKKINDIKCAGQSGYTIAPTPDLSGYYGYYKTDGTATSTINTPFGSVINIGSTTSATTTRPFDGIIGSVPIKDNDILAQASTTESVPTQGLLVRGQQNVATALNAVSDIVLYVFNKVRGAGGVGN